MSRFCDAVGYSFGSEEIGPGVYTPKIVERIYRGDIFRDSRTWEQNKQVNDNLTIGNRISILADDYAFKNFGAIRYVRLYGILWEVKTVDIQRPRLILSLGGVYTSEQT